MVVHEDLPLVAYFNGLGDGRPQRRDDIILWPLRRRGYEIVHREVDWYSTRPYEEDLQIEIANTVDILGVKNRGLVMVGSSAGWSRALNIFADLAEDHSSLWTVNLCGRCSEGSLRSYDPRTLERKAHLGTPSASQQFVESVRRAQRVAIPKLTAEDKLRMFVLYQAFDEVVPRATQLIEGVPDRRLPMVGHAGGILAASLVLPKVIDELTGRKRPATRMPDQLWGRDPL
jgi:hypothetical protein